VGAALAKKSSSNGEQCCFQPGTSDSQKFCCLAFTPADAKVNQNLLVGVATRKPCPMTIHDSVIRLSLAEQEE
jgi:hypothetical protein